jgi:hypothetical protein
MTTSSSRSLCSLASTTVRSHFVKVCLVLAMAMALVSAAQAAPLPTTTSLAISATSVPYKTPITLTATVKSGGIPVSSGIVLFCDATALYCENNSALGVAQLSYPSATAVVKLGSGPIGTHNYKAVYRANIAYATSTSNTVSYSVTGTYSSTTALTSSGAPGSYTLKANIAGVGSLNAGPTGIVSFLDTSLGNNVLGTENLLVSTLSDTFSQSPPFSVGNSAPKEQRSVAIASAYLDGDNNLDVVTGDFLQTITVLLGNGDGTFKPKVNYPGCTVGVATKILLADFNRDGNTDIALGCSDGYHGGLVILLGNGDGTFQPPVSYTTGDVFSIAIGDFNSDGILDIAISDQTQKNITIFTGVGNGSFTSSTPITTVNQAHGIVVGDFNGDGNDDIGFAVTSSTPGDFLSDLYVALGNGQGGFGTPNLVAQDVGEFLVAGDANADNIPDVVSTTITKPGNTLIGNSLFVLIGKGDGTFKPPVTYVSDYPSDPHFADVNGDGVPDVIAGGSTGALVYQGNGDGTFQPYQEPTIGGFILTYAVNAGDYNNDGNADLIGTDADSPQAAVALSQVQQTSDASALTNVAVFPLGSGVHQVDASYSGDSIYIGSLSSTVPLTAAPVPTNLTLTVSPTSGTLSGQSVTLTASLSPYTVGPPTTTTDGEPITFFNGGTPIGTGTLNKGTATLVTSSLPIGAEPLQASFAGDTNYDASSSNVLTVTISSVIVTSSLNPSTYLQPVTLTATLIAGKSGSITFMDGATVLGSTIISGTTASLTTSSLAVGSHDITAIYGPSTSPVLIQVVGKATPVVTVTTSGASVYGGTVTITASVPSGVTGTIAIASGSTPLGSGTITGGVVSITTSSLPAGSDPITATYSGDGNYNPAVGSTTQTVGKLNSTVTVTTSGPSNYGAPVTITAAVTTGATGTIVFTSGGVSLGSGTISSGSVAITTTVLPGGTDAITAAYGGDTNYNSATGTTNQSVSKIATTLTLASSVNPSTVGQSVTFTATVPTVVTGTVTFSNGSTALGTQTISNGTATVTTSALTAGSDSITATYNGNTNYNSVTASLVQNVNKATPSVTVTTSGPSMYGSSVTITAKVPTEATGTIIITSGGITLGSGTISAGSVIITTTVLPVGTDTITANYGGDSNNNAATGSTSQTVTKASPTLALVSSVNPSVINQSVTFTATVPTTASGTVAFTSGATVLGTVNIVNGKAAVTTSALPIGSDPITAVYSGDTNNNAATGNLTQTVNKATPIVTVTTSGSSTYGGSVTIITTVPPGTTGSITVTSGGVTLGSGTINPGGTVTITTTVLPVGSDPITASYGGDSNNNPATGTTTQTVGKATPVLPIPVVSSSNPIVGTPITITETVPPGVSGPVTFSNGSNPIGSAPIVGGVATITATLPTVGTYPITASTPGDANNNPATSPAVDVTVVKTAPEITLISSVNPSTVNQPVTFTATAPAGATGTITFHDGATIIGTGTLAGNQASVTTSSLTTGSHTITASYGGDSNNSAATSSPLLQIVNKATPIVTVTTSGPSTSGSPVTITTTLPPGTTGTVTVTSGGVTLGTGTVNASGTVTITTTVLPIGTDPITASYGGDANNNPATGTTTQTVAKTVATVTLISSANPSYPNTPVTFTATVYAGATAPVTFFDGSTIMGTGAVNAAGVATLTTSSLTIGSHSITAAYAGDANYNSATSAVLVQVVGKIPTTIMLTESNPAQLFGSQVTFTAVVTAPNPTPTGTVSFLDGTTILGMAPLSTNGGGVVVSLTVGNAAFATSTLSDGDHQITAVYSGDNTFTTSTSAPLTNTVEDFTNVNSGPASQQVSPGATTTYNFKLTPVGASTFLDEVTLTVTGLPAGSTYTVTPTSITAGSSETGVVVSVQTSSSLSARNQPLQDDRNSHRELPIALGMLGLAGLGTVRKLRRKLPRPLLLLVLMIATLLPIVALSGCAGGYFAPDPHTYTVTLTGTEGSIQHTATATLVVQ